MIRLSSHHKVRIALALILGLLVTWSADRLAQIRAHQAAEVVVTEFLTVGLTTYVLGDNARLPDELSLYLWMHQVGPQLATLKFGQAMGPGQLESLRIVRIGDTTASRADEWSDGPEPRLHTVRWRIGDNAYEAAWTGDYARNLWALSAIGSFSFAAFALLGWRIPVPLRSEQRAWYDRLRDDGVDVRTALQAAQNQRIPPEGISDDADARFEQLRESGIPAGTAMDWALDDGVGNLSDGQWAWFLIGLNKSEPDIERCLKLARSPDTVEIRFEPPGLSIRGIEVPIKSAALTYYALYAQHRAAGDGWIENPRPGAKLASGPGSLQKEFLTLCDGLSTHAKTTEAVRTRGISALDLDNNRNRIQDHILDALTISKAVSHCSDLAALAAFPYLFESRPVPGKDHKAFRIRLNSEQIRLH